MNWAEKRLNVNQLKVHPFFYGADWNSLRMIEPPFVPRLQSITDTSYFPTDDLGNLPNALEKVEAVGAEKDLAFLKYFPLYSAHSPLRCSSCIVSRSSPTNLSLIAVVIALHSSGPYCTNSPLVPPRDYACSIAACRRVFWRVQCQCQLVLRESELMCQWLLLLLYFQAKEMHGMSVQCIYIAFVVGECTSTLLLVLCTWAAIPDMGTSVCPYDLLTSLNHRGILSSAVYVPLAWPGILPL